MKTVPYGYTNPVKLLDAYRTKQEAYFMRVGWWETRQLFHEAAERVPAYKDFLKKRRIDHTKIRTQTDFTHVPPVDKDSYLRQYPRSMLLWDGKALDDGTWTISATSGSTGEPYYFPRTRYQDLQYALTAELYLRSNFHIEKRSTLYIMTFPLGVWIGGIFTYEAVRLIADRGYRLSIITPGINKDEIIRAVKSLGHEFDQIIIGGYAPFLKDFIDDGAGAGIRWKDHSIGFIFSAECVSLSFKDFLVRKTGLSNVYRQTLNHYGTVDLGTMSHETPGSNLIKRLAWDNTHLSKEIFSRTSFQPTLTQYNPAHFYFEEDAGQLLCTARSGIPLIRYDLKDRGGLIRYDHMMKKLTAHGIDFRRVVKSEGVEDTVWHLPFVYVYERTDMSVSFFAFQIYPETLRKALSSEEFEESLTGKFTMRVFFDKSGNQVFEVNVEMRKGKRESLRIRDAVGTRIIEALMRENSEYRKTREVYPERTVPSVRLWKYEYPLYFRPGTKQRWVAT